MTTIPPERVSDEELAVFAAPSGWFSSTFHVPLREIKLMAIELQQRRAQPDRAAIIEEAAKVADEVAAECPGPWRASAGKVAARIRALSSKGIDQ